jgi:pimeloyl-ACP methyl ester carboxylesterase
MRTRTSLGVVLTVGLTALVVGRALQAPEIRPLDEAALREYTGVYQWDGDGFVYLQLWKMTSFEAPSDLVAFDESGDVRALYSTSPDRFFSGPGAAIRTTVESRVEFERDNAGTIVRMTWRREGAEPRSARPRADTERREDVQFTSGAIRIAGTLSRPVGGGRMPAIALVHGSGPEDRDYVLPWARFLVRHGVAVLGYDKRGVGGSGGDWNNASFDDLAGDAIAAVQYLKTRPDIDGGRIGLLGISQAGWILPLAAVQSKEVSFLISVSGAGVPVADTTLDQAANEMTASGMKPPTIAAILDLMKRQYDFARTGQGWEEYTAARAALAANRTAPRQLSRSARSSPLAGRQAFVFPRSPSDSAPPADANAGDLGRVGQQHPPGQEQDGMGRSPEDGGTPRLHAHSAAESQSLTV